MVISFSLLVVNLGHIAVSIDSGIIMVSFYSCLLNVIKFADRSLWLTTYPRNKSSTGRKTRDLFFPGVFHEHSPTICGAWLLWGAN